MIKGVNKQVLEINETQSGFFEKAIFFVKPEYIGMGEGKLREKAKSEFQEAGKPPKTKKDKKNKVKTAICLIGCFLTGLAAGFIFSVGL